MQRQLATRHQNVFLAGLERAAATQYWQGWLRQERAAPICDGLPMQITRGMEHAAENGQYTTDRSDHNVVVTLHYYDNKTIIMR